MILNSQVKIGTWFVGDWRSNDNSTFFPKLRLFLDHQEYKIVYILSFVLEIPSLFFYNRIWKTKQTNRWNSSFNFLYTRAENI